MGLFSRPVMPEDLTSQHIKKTNASGSPAATQRTSMPSPQEVRQDRKAQWRRDREDAAATYVPHRGSRIAAQYADAMHSTMDTVSRSTGNKQQAAVNTAEDYARATRRAVANATSRDDRNKAKTIADAAQKAAKATKAFAKDGSPANKRKLDAAKGRLRRAERRAK